MGRSSIGHTLNELQCISSVLFRLTGLGTEPNRELRFLRIRNRNGTEILGFGSVRLRFSVFSGRSSVLGFSCPGLLHKIAASIGGGVSVAKAQRPLEGCSRAVKDRAETLAGSHQLVIRARFIGERLSILCFYSYSPEKQKKI